METIGERIKKMRLEKDWTQKDLAKALGLKNDTAIANYESNYSTPKDDIKFKLCYIFNCTMDYLMGLTSYKNATEDLETDLYKLNLTEKEFDDLICLVKENKLPSVKFLLSKESDKFTRACKICSYLDWDYTIPYTEELTDEQERELQLLTERNREKVKSTLLSLNKNKVVHDLSRKFYMCPVYGKISAGIPNWAEECLEGYLPIDPNLMGIINPEECFFLRVDGQSMNKVIRRGAYALIRKQDMVENGEIAAVLVNGFEATLKKFSKQGDLVILEPMSDDSSFTTQVYGKDTEIRILGKYIGKFEMNK